jgi:6-phosphofructokinase 1
MTPIKKIAITTGGGDAPGLNAVIRAAVLSALKRGWECVGIREGYNGIMFPENYPDGDGIIPLNHDAVRGITHLGGTILGTTNRGNPFSFPFKEKDGTVREVDRSDEVIDLFRKHGIDALISIGGDGSMTIANGLAQKGLRVIGVPKTIDNDLDGTVIIWFRHCRFLRHRMFRSFTFHCRIASAGAGGGSDGSLRRMDRA